MLPPRVGPSRRTGPAVVTWRHSSPTRSTRPACLGPVEAESERDAAGSRRRCPADPPLRARRRRRHRSRRSPRSRSAGCRTRRSAECRSGSSWAARRSAECHRSGSCSAARRRCSCSWCRRNCCPTNLRRPPAGPGSRRPPPRSRRSAARESFSSAIPSVPSLFPPLTARRSASHPRPPCGGPEPRSRGRVSGVCDESEKSLRFADRCEAVTKRQRCYPSELKSPYAAQPREREPTTRRGPGADRFLDRHRGLVRTRRPESAPAVHPAGRADQWWLLGICGPSASSDAPVFCAGSAPAPWAASSLRSALVANSAGSR